MVWFITSVHILLCLIIMVVILLQAGKGAEIGAVFGGSSQTVFGGRGAATFLSKVTTVCAIGFMVTSLTLFYLGSNEATRSIMQPSATGGTQPPAATEAPAAVPAPAQSETAAPTPAQSK